jgi:hypothetical protein
MEDLSRVSCAVAVSALAKQPGGLELLRDPGAHLDE